jgi:hemoglobin/transferrin/lactoferrin receptor protein
VLPTATTTAVLDLDGKDTLERNRLSAEYRYNDLNSAWVQKIETRVYVQDAKINQFSAETRNGAANRTRDNTFKTKIVGVSTQLETNLSGAVNQRLSYGLDWSRSDISGLRDGTVPPAGETFPSKPFPDSSYTQLGAFVQSEIELGQFSIIPGLRFDRYDLSPSADGYSGTPTALSGQATTPRLGAVWKLDPAFSPYAQYSQGYRAPTPDQVNNGFTNLVQGYMTVGNANLKAEQAESYELGFRGKLNNFRYSVSAYDSNYKDFISQQQVTAVGVSPIVFQYINLAKAHISGGELRGEWQINSQWKANAGLAYAKGESDSNGVKAPLDSVQPQRTILGVAYDAGVWSARANVVHSDGKTADQISTGTAQFAPGAYDVVDVGFTWKPINNLTLNANINNLLDTTYWRWGDVSGLAASSTIKDAYTAPGRTIQVGVRYDF